MNVLKPAGWAGVLCVFFGVAFVGATPALQDPPEVVTKAMRKALDQQFPEWATAPAAACPTAVDTPATADVDFDMETDVAMIVAVPGGEPHMVVAMPRVIAGSIVHDLGPLSAIPGATHLVVLPLGTAVRGPGDMFNDYLSGPTFAAASCDKPLVAFVWTGYGFRKRPIS
ncbi:MAG: hypothetical protein IT185_11345 [Acidobacteria bacterium]|nr:hypothetical protein [Acidobacteriota bacterium]